ncbi:hypothetical protein E2C01_079444 [Portunus trituberculatus]|uniref:Uncharacterized protein n=1 Tax=Portunus trituberculatus TaxID=210409 RepID=A0A5B7IVN2_PORTR|nr:hypothetical protein [Portunus trituberculatus]
MDGLFGCLSACLPVCPPVCQPVCPSVYLPVHYLCTPMDLVYPVFVCRKFMVKYVRISEGDDLDLGDWTGNVTLDVDHCTWTSLRAVPSMAPLKRGGSLIMGLYYQSSFING